VFFLISLFRITGKFEISKFALESFRKILKKKKLNRKIHREEKKSGKFLGKNYCENLQWN
jgi:hypothetical protein